MKIVGVLDSFRVYNDDLKVFDKLPVNAYTLEYDSRSGHYLKVTNHSTVGEKIYGPHKQKVDKIFDSFKIFDRNLGVILSGAKGIGKSVCAKLLSIRGVQEGYPVIFINQYSQGLADYLASIEQAVVVVFDEFDKTFNEITDNCGNRVDVQSELLTMFDGVMQSEKKLFVVTCNRLEGLNEYLVNRPGRFHYHLRFDYPEAEEIREYLGDKITSDAKNEIEKVVAFGRRVNLNFDCLRSIAFELNAGYKFEDAIKDLNILNLEEEASKLQVIWADGSHSKIISEYVDTFSDESVSFWFDHRNKHRLVSFIPSDSTWSFEHGGMIITEDKISSENGFTEEGEASENNREHFVKPVVILIKKRIAKTHSYLI